MAIGTRGVERVTLADASNYMSGILCMGVDSAISYHGYGNSDYLEHPIFVTDKLPVGTHIAGEPWVVGIRSPREMLKTEYPNILVTNLVDSILDTMEFNKYSENVMEALRWLEQEENIQKELAHEAERRGLTELLKWEYKEMEEYFNY